MSCPQMEWDMPESLPLQEAASLNDFEAHEDLASKCKVSYSFSPTESRRPLRKGMMLQRNAL